jgi:ribose 1,5-bisphosphokinase PhnN
MSCAADRPVRTPDASSLAQRRISRAHSNAAEAHADVHTRVFAAAAGELLG